jgi:nicotinate-nucleotide adenylyltransferase
MPNDSSTTPNPSAAAGAHPRRRLCFGGTFNPIHHGHLLCARAIAELSGFDRVTLIPSAEPPHKTSRPGMPDLASAQDRLAMCRLAVEADPLFEVNDVELKRSGPSFTIDTARELKRQAWPDVSWLIGGDTVDKLPSWHEALNLLAEVRFVIMGRPGSSIDWSLLPEPYQVLKSQVFVIPLIEISASEIRSRLYDGRSVRYLTPDPVTAYISNRGLYR